MKCTLTVPTMVSDTVHSNDKYLIDRVINRFTVKQVSSYSLDPLKYRFELLILGNVRSGSQTHTLPELLQPHKTIELSSIRQQLISDELVKMYQSGMSLADLAKQTGIAQTTIRARLIKSGIEMRPKFSIPFEQARRKTGKRNILPYYGFCYFQGRVVPNPKEYDHLMKVYNLWKMRMNPNAIAKHLNSKKIPPRSATNWNRNSIVNIINRFEKRLIVFKNGQLEFQ